VIARHKHYVNALSAAGVIVELGRFKKKLIRCLHCKKEFVRHEEKETDVAVALKVLELFALDIADRVVLITGDTDLAPAVRTAKRLYPVRKVCFAFPWNRKRDELEKLADSPCISISREAYRSHQFADPVVLGGKSYDKPASW
jgi:uncharacterized LabA/DUF88 family protein